jgi:nicotinate-nucleotide--dimethylbenzimidazole phosphoribosyltransferase
MSQVLDHVIESIGPASEANAEMARSRLAGVGAPMLEKLAARLAGAQHTPAPRSDSRRIVVVIGDHGCGDPGIVMNADHPSVIAATAIADGNAALCQVARSPGTPIVLVDAGSREPSHMPGIAIQLGRGPTYDLMREPAMTVVDAVLGLEAGIALAMSLAEGDATHDRVLDVVAIGALGVGAEVASAAILGAVTRRPVVGLGDEMAEAASVKGASLVGASPTEILATFGGSETAVLAGLMLGCASINVPVILDGYATGAAALVATAFAPLVTGYLVAAHRGGFTMPGILAHLGLEPIFDVGLGHGEGTGAAMVLPLIDQVAALVRTR